MEAFNIGTSKKAIDEKILRFLRRLGTIHDQWLVCGDIWVPAERLAKTRPGVHLTRNPQIQLNVDCADRIYKTKPIGEIMTEFESLEGKVKNAFLIQNMEMITLEISFRDSGDVLIVLATLVVNDEDKKRYPMMLRDITFQGFMENQGYWTELKEDVLMAIKKGNVFQIEDNGFVLARLVRNMFKLRGRSERVNADIDYTAKYCIILKPGKRTEGILGSIGFLLYVNYGFIEAISYYINIPYPLNNDLIGTNVDLGLFDEDGADDGLEVVD